MNNTWLKAYTYEISGPGDDLDGMVEEVVIGKWIFSFCYTFFSCYLNFPISL